MITTKTDLQHDPFVNSDL